MRTILLLMACSLILTVPAWAESKVSPVWKLDGIEQFSKPTEIGSLKFYVKMHDYDEPRSIEKPASKEQLDKQLKRIVTGLNLVLAPLLPNDEPGSCRYAFHAPIINGAANVDISHLQTGNYYLYITSRYGNLSLHHSKTKVMVSKGENLIEIQPLEMEEILGIDVQFDGLERSRTLARYQINAGIVSSGGPAIVKNGQMNVKALLPAMTETFDWTITDNGQVLYTGTQQVENIMKTILLQKFIIKVDE